jgi:hypothetical protein
LAEPAAKGSSSELAQARVKIAEHEPKVGQQALDIDFFHKALRALDAAGRTRARRAQSSLILPFGSDSARSWASKDHHEAQTFGQAAQPRERLASVGEDRIVDRRRCQLAAGAVTGAERCRCDVSGASFVMTAVAASETVS